MQRSHYAAALRAMQVGDADPLAQASRALVESPTFVPAHVLHASLLAYSRDVRDFREGRAAVERLSVLEEGGHLTALRAGLEGDYRAARAGYDAILAGDAHDFVALWVSEGLAFSLGEPQAMRDRTAKVLAQLSPAAPGYHAV